MCITRNELEKKIEELRSLKALKEETENELKALEHEVISYMTENELTEEITNNAKITYKPQSRTTLDKAKLTEVLGDDLKSYERERKMIYHKAEGRCQLCGCKITYDEMSLDHIVPLAMGGEDSLENLQATCEPCNSHKKALLPEAYFDKVNRTFVFQMNKKYSHNLLWKLSKLFIGRLEKQA